MTGDSFLHLQGESHILTLAQPVSAGPHPQNLRVEREMAPLWKETDWFCIHKDQPGCSDPHEQ